MWRNTIRVGLMALAAMSVMAIPARASSLDDLFELGADLGFASFQARVAGSNCTGPARDLAVDAINNARNRVVYVQNAGDHPAIQTAALEALPKCASGDQIEAARATLSGEISQWGGAFANAYALGVNLAIAEAQTTAGEAARQIVYISLTNAKPAAVALGLDVTGLTECISLASGSTSLDEIHAKLVSLRSSYQGVLLSK